MDWNDLNSPPESDSKVNQTSLLKLQQAFIDLRFGMFIHFNMATFQNLEWGDPRGPVSAFNPSALDTDQWAAAALAAGMTYACLTTKHHDGFAIWPTKTGAAGVKTHDIVRDYTTSFRKAGIKIGLYYSILDLRADIRKFCITSNKIRLIKDQLSELLTGYGNIELLVFDGWNAPWSRISYEELPFDTIYNHVKALQPNCLVMDLNSSEFPSAALYYTDIKSFESNAGQELPGGNDLPAQCCNTLTDGWFWKSGDEHSELKSAKHVVQDWLVPQNKRFCNLLLNAAPNREGRLAPNIVARLEDIGRLWKHPGPAKPLKLSMNITTKNLALCKPIFANASRPMFGPDLANDGFLSHTWCPPPGERSGWLEIDLVQPTKFNTLVLYEPIGRWEEYNHSRIDRYRFMALAEGKWFQIASAEGEGISGVRMHHIPQIVATRLRLELEGEGAGDEPHVGEVGIYDMPSFGNR